MPFFTLLRILIFASMGLLVSTSFAADARGPNILLILADDLAWADAGCYGHRWHQTPHIDGIARDGLRVLRGYAGAPICSASRASLLTGKTTARLGFEFVTKNQPGRQQIDADVPLETPPFTLNLPLEDRTIPEFLSEQGYESAFFGKWHLNAHHQRYLGWSPTHGPLAQGFDVATEDFGSHPYAWGKSEPPAITTAGKYPADSMIDRACRFVQQEREHPFFLMVSLYHVHTPVKSRCEWLLEKYAATIPKETPRRQKRIAYAAFVEELDHHVGTLLAALEDAGQTNSTLVVFTSDNGGHPEYTVNGPLRGSKWNLYEGGIRVPFLVRWPGHIAPGLTSQTPVIGYDLLPTFVSVAGGRASGVDGLDVSPLFVDPQWQPARDLVWHFPYYHPEKGYADARESIGVDDFAVSRTRPQSAILRGQHKLMHFYEDDHVELYDLKTDVGEQQDRQLEDPALRRDLADSLKHRLNEVRARLPVPAD